MAAAPEARKPEPIQREQLVGGHVIGRDDDHPARTTGADPVLRQRDRLGGACARRVDLGVRAPGTNQLGELGVAHREHAEEEATIELVRLVGDLEIELVDAALDLGEGGAGAVLVAQAALHRPQRLELLPARAVDPEAVHLVGEVVHAREGGGENDPGVVAQRVRQHPAIGEQLAGGRRLVVLYEGDPRVAHGVDARADRQLRLAPERQHAFGRDAELLGEIEGAGARGQLDHVVLAVDRLERPAAALALHQPRDVVVEDLVAQLGRDHVDELLALQYARDVGVVEHALDAREAEGRAGDDHGLHRPGPAAAAQHRRPRSITPARSRPSSR